MFPKLGFSPTEVSLPLAAGSREREPLAMEREVEIRPVPPSVPRPIQRIVGPGRRERAYLAQVAALEREIETISLVERGSARRLDRMERKLAATREAALELERREKRLILALGALQRENEILREKLALQLAPPRKRTLLAKLLGRA